VIQVLPEPLSWWTGCFCGITLTNVYGTGREARSSGDDIFEPLRAELDRRGTLAFLHGEQTPGRYRAPSRFLPTPVAEVPNETYKAATDLVTSGRKRQYPNVRIILSHSGGSTRYCQDCGWVVSGDLRFG
jgi:predicted TIM-barrel fold metal-dependent hydrolase